MEKEDKQRKIAALILKIKPKKEEEESDESSSDYSDDAMVAMNEFIAAVHKKDSDAALEAFKALSEFCKE